MRTKILLSITKYPRTCTLHARYLGQHIHTPVVSYLLLFHCNTPQSYAIHILLALLLLYLTYSEWIKNYVMWKERSPVFNYPAKIPEQNIKQNQA